ncbi:hypothetical protein EJ04DRAFT_567924 [Polyplosphaeria fusca]|uniref:Protein SQS1 n=1 Tax=Polyplosphaeria fusca TaxID=682080 RepID=A0A9P4QSR9_9PLEO|nr:hypothetical protein EJ04DRAFT_567924 [Polyplosphaeria fusca]
MPRKKRGRQAKPAPRSSHHHHHHHSSNPPRGAFTLADEGRFYTNHRSRAFEPDRKLRLLPVGFVSAGCLVGTVPDKEEGTGPPAPFATPDSPADDASKLLATMALRSSSPSNSSDVSDEIVFQGRGPTPAIVAPDTGPVALAAPTSDAPVMATDASVASPSVNIHGTVTQAASRLGKTRVKSIRSVDIPTLDSPIESDSDVESVVQDLFKHRLGNKTPWDYNTTEWVSRSKPGIGWLPAGEANPAVTAEHDYMRNIEDFLPQDCNVTPATRTFAGRDLDIDAGWVSPPMDPVDTFRTSGRCGEWSENDLCDFEELSTSSDVMDVVERIIATRFRRPGKQYLVVYEGAVADDAHWLPVSFLRTPSDLQLIKDFEAEVDARQQLLGLPSTSESNSSDGYEDANDSDDEDEFDLDISALDDEQLAAILQKQEDLGMGSSEIVLFGGDETFRDITRTTDSGRRGADRPQQRRQQRSRGFAPSFPSASAMADVLDSDPYNGFDVMDTERPSLRPRNKGRRGQMPVELSDEELNEQIKASWENDRNKKRIKKAEREEQRQQGLLGRKGKTPDLGVKYKDGIVMEEIVEEIREFMISEAPTISLPPMDAGRRAAVHQFAALLGLKSTSRGDGPGRFTVLVKNKRTMEYADKDFEGILGQKGLNKRMRGALAVRSAPRGQAQKTKSTHPLASYKDGEVVGRDAPELGPENRGRAMLEKMGWKKGMGLGALDNKGILQPIAHTVKTTRAGLQ